MLLGLIYLSNIRASFASRCVAFPNMTIRSGAFAFVLPMGCAFLVASLAPGAPGTIALAATGCPNRRGSKVKKLLMLLVLALIVPTIAVASELPSTVTESKDAASALQESDGCAEPLPFTPEVATSGVEGLPVSSLLESVPDRSYASSGECCEWNVMNNFCNTVCGEAGWSSNGGWCLQGHCQISCTCNGPGLEEAQ